MPVMAAGLMDTGFGINVHVFTPGRVRLNF